MHRRKSKFSAGKHKINHNSNTQGENVSFINARRTKPNFNHQWDDTNKQRFNKFTNLNVQNKGNINSAVSQNNNTNKIESYISKIDFKNSEKIISGILEQFRANDLEILHRIDEKTLEEAIIEYRKDIAELAIIAYSFRKLLSKKHIFNSPNWKGFREKTINDLQLAIELSKKENKDEYNKKIKEIENSIEKTDQLLGHFIHDIVFNARTKLASSAYAYGLSLSQASNLLSANKDQVMELIGQTKISDEDIKSKTMFERIDFLKKNIPENKEKKVQKK